MPPTCVCYQAPFDLLFGTGKFGYATVVAVRSPVRTPGELRVGLTGLAEAAGWTPCALPQAGGSFRAQSPGRWMAAPCEEVHLHEHTAGRATLAVLGAGPKGLAIAAKRVALARAGRDVPDLILIDRQGIAASSSSAPTAACSPSRWRTCSTGPRRSATRQPPRTSLERSIGHDLAVTGLDPKLHLPVLAGVAQGPGFPNLSCLGLLADRVLGAYTGPMTDAAAPATDTAAAPGR